MCFLAVHNPVVCSCQDPDCRQLRPFESRNERNLPGHVVGADEIRNVHGLPCTSVLRFHGYNALVSGRGDQAMLDISLKFCPQLRATFSGQVRRASGVCNACMATCSAPERPRVETSSFQPVESDAAKTLHRHDSFLPTPPPEHVPSVRVPQPVRALRRHGPYPPIRHLRAGKTPPTDLPESLKEFQAALGEMVLDVERQLGRPVTGKSEALR